MIEPQVFILPDVIPPGAVEDWRRSLPEPKGEIPAKVLEFIEGLAPNLPDFKQYQKETDYITGRELMLCGLTVWGGVWIDPVQIYSLDVPKMQAVDNRTSMIRIFMQKGKAGLINYVKIQLRGHTLQRILHHLHVNIFNEQDPASSKEFQSMMSMIQSEKRA